MGNTFTEPIKIDVRPLRRRLLTDHAADGLKPLVLTKASIDYTEAKRPERTVVHREQERLKCRPQRGARVHWSFERHTKCRTNLSKQRRIAELELVDGALQ